MAAAPAPRPSGTAGVLAPDAWLDQPLPPLRDDVVLHPGPAEADGSPTWTVYDPARHRYFRFGRAGFEFLARWSGTSGRRLLAAIAAETTVRTEAADLAQFFQFLRHNNLLRGDDPLSGQALLRQGLGARRSWAVWLLHHYLFIRIPLCRPDRFLARTWPLARLVFNRGFLRLTLVLGAIGLVLAARQWDQFLHTAQHFFTLEGAAAFALTLFLVKLCHELGHAYTAKRYGCRVPTMGVALLVLWPVLYTDVTDSWRLVSRRQRLLIDGAGILTELGLALLATFLWSFLPDGPLRSAAFLVATTTWVTTLAINASPFMRFDGYYLLSDLLAVSNLQDRSFALARWHLRECLFGFGEPPPEVFPPAERRKLLLYAWATWLYRLVLFLGIALLVYHFFFKLLGIFLFMVEISWFVLLPVVRELREWRRRRLRLNRRSLVTLAGLVLLLALVAMPWQSRLYLPAVLRASGYATLFAPVPARLVELRAEAGQTVQAGQVLYRLEAPELSYRLASAAEQRRVIELQIARQAVSADSLENLGVLEAQLAANLSTTAGLEAQRRRLDLSSPVSGVLGNVPPELRPGLWLRPDQPLGEVIQPSAPLIRAYLATTEVMRLQPGAAGRFIPENPALPSLPVVVSRIEQVTVAVLDQPLLASTQGGPIAVQPDAHGALVPNPAVVRLECRPAPGEPAPPVPLQTTPGMVVVEGEAASLARRAWRAVAAVAIRESGF